MQSKIIKEDIKEIVSEFDRSLYNLKGKEILITGGNGFIPSYIIDTISSYNNYLDDKCKLLVLNKNELSNSSRLSHLKDNSFVKFISQDVGKDFQILGNLQIILHAASRANPISFKKEPLDTIDTNVYGMRNLLNYSKKNSLESFLFFSSSEVYGDPPKKEIPTSENYFGNVNPLDEMACYSESKRFCETLGKVFFNKYGVPFNSLRIFHTFGPGIRNDGKTITNLFDQAINNKKINLRNSGKAKRSYSYISDTIRGIFNVLFKGIPGEAYNIGSDSNNTSVKEIANYVARNFKNVEVYVPKENSKKLDPISDRSPNLSKLRNLGFVPKISVEEGIKRLKEHYMEVGI